MEAVERYVRATLSEEEQLAMLQVAMRELNRYGVTSVVNATGDLAEIKLYAALRDRGALTVRTRTAFGAVCHAAPADAAVSRRSGGSANGLSR